MVRVIIRVSEMLGQAKIGSVGMINLRLWSDEAASIILIMSAISRIAKVRLCTVCLVKSSNMISMFWSPFVYACIAERHKCIVTAGHTKVLSPVFVQHKGYVIGVSSDWAIKLSSSTIWL